MIKKVISFVMCCALILSMSDTAFAANTTDTSYYKNSVPAGTWRDTPEREKENNSKVYIKPLQAPNSKTKVRTYCYVSGNGSNQTTANYVVVEDNIKYAITNYVYEHGDHSGSNNTVKMWLSLTPKSGTGTLSGNWSPDWSGSGYVTIV